MSVTTMVLQLLLGLAILIILHELGHYLAARAFGIRVEKFFLFFDAWGVKLFSIKRGDTEVGIGWLPLGGYVKIAGMIDESMDKEQMALPPKPDEFRSKPAWQRLIVMLAGVTVNVVLGVVIFWILTLRFGQSYVPMSAYTNGIVPGKALKELGVKAGDHIVRIGSKAVTKNTDLFSSEFMYGNVNLGLSRQGKDTSVHVPSNFVETLTKYGTKEDLFVPRMQAKIDSVLRGSHAEQAGLKKGDVLAGVNGVDTHYYDQFQDALAVSKGRNLLIQIIRNGETKEIHASTNENGKLGIYNALPNFAMHKERFGVIKSFEMGSTRAFGALTDNAKGLAKVAKRELSIKTLSGPIGIAKVYGSEFDWVRFWGITGMLSMALAFINILPIPALDGGHALFLIIEMIKGRPLSEKFLESAQLVGFFVILSLMVLMFSNDIIKLIVK